MRHSIAGLLLFFAVTPLAAAAEHDRCDIIDTANAIPGFTAAAVEDKASPKFPKRSQKDQAEGWVLLQYAVTSEGKVRDVKAVEAVGPKYFVSAAVEAAEDWTYKPATRNGGPVEQTLMRTAVLFNLENSGRSTSHTEFVKKYNRAREQMNDGEVDAAITALDQALKSPLNLYEAAMGSFALAHAYSKKKEWARALIYARNAVIQERQYLLDEIRAPALTLLIDLEARNGHYTEALCAYEKLKSVDAASAGIDSPSGKIAAQLRAALAGASQIVLDARLVEDPFSDKAVWRHRLLRSKFSFAEVKGTLSTFSLDCISSQSDGPVELGAQWAAPPKAGACILKVEGDAGASFKLIEK